MELERETGIEPATSSLGSWHSTTELLPLRIAVTPEIVTFCAAASRNVSYGAAGIISWPRAGPR